MLVVLERFEPNIVPNIKNSTGKAAVQRDMKTYTLLFPYTLIHTKLSTFNTHRISNCPVPLKPPAPHTDTLISLDIFHFPMGTRSVAAPQMPTSSLGIPAIRLSRYAVCSRSCCYGDDASGPASRVSVENGSEDRPGITNEV